MKCRLIQTSKLQDDNKAEKAMLQFLHELPESYTVYRELQVNRAYQDRVNDMQKAQPDFVVVSADTGLLSIEVKDWNLDRNQYIWRDQYKVIKRDVASGRENELTNPAAQADTYRYAFMELLEDVDIWKTSIVAFPLLSRQAFLNSIANIEVLQNPQSRFFLDLEMVIFKEDIDAFFMNPDRLLKRIVRKHNRFRQASERDVYAANERLLPNSFRIGDLTKRQQEQKQLKMISREQEKWIFDLDRRSSYLLDVAGSGKTNVLVSRALHIIDQAHKQRQKPPNVLLTTYNPNLQRNIERILAGKIKPDERHTRYKTLRVENVEYIMERVAAEEYELKNRLEYYKEIEPKSKNYEKILREDVRAALQESPDKYQVFDYVFIDEIQDFDDEQLYLIRKLARQDNFFFVGDIGQKIYDRYHDLKRHGFVIDELELPKSYKMYRTPRYIGDLAYRFVRADPVIKEEFESNGYRQDTQFASYSDNAAELLRTPNQISAVVERIEDLLAGQYREDDLMIITSMAQLRAYGKALRQAGFSFQKGEPGQENQISLVDFMNVKGLEREVVIVTGIEDLYDHSDGLFDDAATQLEKERFSRRKLYVALTRAIESCIIYYSDPANRFINELININRKIIDKRQAAK